MDIESLEVSIKENELQLQNVELLGQAASGEDLDNLEKLAADLREVISLSKQSLDLLKIQAKGNENAIEDPFELEYARLKAELGDSIPEDTNNTGQLNGSQSLSLAETSESIQLTDEFPELANLEGQKCRAPFSHSWGPIDYHNAMIVGLEGIEVSDGEPCIKVRIFYLMPTHESMKTCQYFLDGKCRFDEEECRFSHGEIVSLQDLRDYEEPNFLGITKLSKILCRYEENDLWYNAAVKSVGENNRLIIVYDSYPNQDYEVGLEDVWPLETVVREEASDDGSDFELNPTDDRIVQREEEEENEVVQTNFLSGNVANSALGEWEKHTKGFGSKMMTRLGYVMGSGLGKSGEGRTEPVEAIVLPPGRSLDRCMEMKEKAKGRSLLSVEARLKRQKMIAERQDKKFIEKQIAQENHFQSLFDVLNARMSSGIQGSTWRKEKDSTSGKELKKESSKNLNLKNFQICENIRKCDSELKRLRESRLRHLARNDKLASEMIQKQIDTKENELKQLKRSEKAVSREQDSRNLQKKLQIF
ncbi:zinc finger CCCH-type with G patch domain-containing protein-like isoform X1 [Artemia franciscana]|uniref:zinc finger CCCH-type with G patch domain-containing protein-like isoform X1 n=1 Tax=Artemia franciscana TaxID=6661 RepID=UPI0032DBADC8